MNEPIIDQLIEFLRNSPVNFFAIKSAKKMLGDAGYRELKLTDNWQETVRAGGKYFVTKNDSALMAFNIAERHEASTGFRIIAAHSDSPGFRIKPAAEMFCEGGVVKLNTEVYGGPILYTWFDRPLSIAGRVVLRSPDFLHPRTEFIDFRTPLLTIPHLAIHFNRAVNEGNPLSKQKDMLPVIAVVNDRLEADNMLLNLIADKLNVNQQDILDFDLSLYDTTAPCRVGLHQEFLSAGRIDDLSMVHAALSALLDSSDMAVGQHRIAAIFDNEETGSGTKQGAASTFLKECMTRILNALGHNDPESYYRAVANSFMISADNAHALHPNYVEKQDPTNHPIIGRGPVIKINANCKYMTDADSAAVFRSICEDADVPYQYFVNHSDVAGGSTLGNILTSQVSLRGVDMGAPIWAMHSVRETAGVADHIYCFRAFRKFYTL